jgi:flagellar motor switch protein FliN/FliY
MSEIKKANETSSCERAMEEAHHFLDVPMKVTIQLSSRSMKVRDILQLQTNSIVDLPKSAGENVDILVNERLVAFGEVIELEGSTGIRLTDLNTLV